MRLKLLRITWENMRHDPDVTDKQRLEKADDYIELLEHRLDLSQQDATTDRRRLIDAHHAITEAIDTPLDQPVLSDGSLTPWWDAAAKIIRELRSRGV